MNILKRILSYFIWTTIAFLYAFGYLRIILGPMPETSNGLMRMFDWIYVFGFLYLGAIIGSIIASIYILIDIFYLNKKLKDTANSVITRLLIVFLITVFVGVIHYILEKVIDVI